MNDLTKSEDFIHNSEVTAFKWSKMQMQVALIYLMSLYNALNHKTLRWTKTKFEEYRNSIYLKIDNVPSRKKG